MTGFPELTYEAPNEDDPLGLPDSATSLDLLRAVYRKPTLSLSTRMRAAGLALPHEHPKLGVSVNINDDGTFAQRLDAAIERSRNGSQEPKVIEHRASEGPIEHSASELREPSLGQRLKTPLRRRA